MKRIFTSESITQGHPDRICDTVVNTILDIMLEQDPDSRAGLEMLVTTNLMILSGEVKTNANIDYEGIARDVVSDIGYNDPSDGFCAQTFEFINKLNTQSPDISKLVDGAEEVGAGDIGIMFGYATNETDGQIPITALMANALTFRHQEVLPKWTGVLKPDAKSQVTYSYEEGKVKTIVMSVSHYQDVTKDELDGIVMDEIIKPVYENITGHSIHEDKVQVLINAFGPFVKCGPDGDCGVVGRKLVVDSYGGHGHIGGGATNGKDPSKVDASAARAARHAACNLVAAGLCDECEIQLAYSIGNPQPISINVETFGTEKVPVEKIEEFLTTQYDFSVSGIIRNLQLTLPQYGRLTFTGQFGQKSTVFDDCAEYTIPKIPTWELLDIQDKIKEFFSL